MTTSEKQGSSSIDVPLKKKVRKSRGLRTFFLLCTAWISLLPDEAVVEAAIRSGITVGAEGYGIGERCGIVGPLEVEGRAVAADAYEALVEAQFQSVVLHCEACLAYLSP